MSCGSGETVHPETSNLWIVGIVISIAGSCASNGGVNLQKMSIMREMNKARSEQRPYVLQPLWLIGLLGVIFGAIADFGALAFAAQSLLTPVGGFTVVANCWFARICLGERMSRKDGIATLLITIGIIMIATSGDKGDTCYTLQQLVTLYGEPSFVGYIIGVGVTVVGLYAFHKYATRIRSIHGPWSPMYTRIRRAHMITYPVLSGVMGAQSILFAKSTAELIKETARGENQLKYFGFYAILAALVFTIVSQLHWLAIALKNADALLVIPIFQSFFIIISIIGGGVYFKELDKLSQTNTAIFCAGVMIMMSGIYMLAQRSLGGSTEPPRMTFLTLAAQFVVRTRRAARFRQASRWPNRLHLYSCNCDCHWEEINGHKIVHNKHNKLLDNNNIPNSTRNTAGGRPLETIMDGPVDDDEGDDDEHHNHNTSTIPLHLDHHPPLHYHPHDHPHNLRHRHNHDHKTHNHDSPSTKTSLNQSSPLSILDPPGHRTEGYERVLTEASSPGRSNSSDNLRQRTRSHLSNSPILNTTSNGSMVSPNDLGIIQIDDNDLDTINGAGRDTSPNKKFTMKEQIDNHDYIDNNPNDDEYDDPPTLPDAPTHDAYGNELPRMCKYCWCRLTPLPVIELYKKLSVNNSSANVVSHLLPNMGVNIIDDGSSESNMNIIPSGRSISDIHNPVSSSTSTTASTGPGALPLPLTNRAQLQRMPSMSADWDRALAEVNGTSTNGTIGVPSTTASRLSAGPLDSDRSNTSGFTNKTSTNASGTGINTSTNINVNRVPNTSSTNANNTNNNTLFQGTYFRPDDPSSVGVRIYNLRSNSSIDDDGSPGNYISRDDPLGLDLPLTIPRLQDIGDGLARLRSGTATGIRFVGSALGTALGSVAGAVVSGTNPNNTNLSSGNTGTTIANNTIPIPIPSTALPGGRTIIVTKQSPSSTNTNNQTIDEAIMKKRSPNAVMKRSPSMGGSYPDSTSPTASNTLSNVVNAASLTNILRPVAKAVSAIPSGIPPAVARGNTETIAFQTLHDDDGTDEHLNSNTLANATGLNSETSPTVTDKDRISPTRGLRLSTSTEDAYMRIKSPEKSGSEYPITTLFPSNGTGGNEAVSSSTTTSSATIPKPSIVIDQESLPPARRLRSSTSTDGDTTMQTRRYASGNGSSHSYRSASAERTRTGEPVGLQRKRSAPAISPNDNTNNDRIPSLVRSSTMGGVENNPNNQPVPRARNRGRRQRGPHLDQPFPPPGAVVVGAGLEAATFLTVAAIKRLLNSNLNNKKRNGS